MAKQGLIRVPYYPQLSCLNQVHPHACLVMSALLFWMGRSQTQATFCEQRHNYQLALHLGLDYKEFTECLAQLKAQNLFIEHSFVILPKEKTAESKERTEIRLNLDFVALQQLLQRLGCNIKLKLLLHAADDSFDIYDVIDDKQLPVLQSLHGHVSGEQYHSLALEACKFLIFVNEHCENLASLGIAPGWKLLLALPMSMSEDEYAKVLVERFMRPQEKAIDFNFSDGNFFLPDHDEIQGEVHSVKHYRKHAASMALAAALMLHLAENSAEQLYFTSELSVEQLYSAFMVFCQFNGHMPKLSEHYYAARQLTGKSLEDEQAHYLKLATKITEEVAKEKERNEKTLASANS